MKQFLIILTFFVGLNTFSQLDSTFGENLFKALQQDTTNWKGWYITLEEYHQLIERQRMTQSAKNEFKLSVNESYKLQYENFIQEMKNLQDEYTIDQKDAFYKLIKVETEPLEQVKDIYYFRLYIEYHWKKKRDPYVLEFQATKMNERWIMMEPLQEYHQ